MCGTPLLMKDRGDWGLVISFHGKKGGSYKRMIGTRKGKSCRAERGLLLLSTFEEEKFDECGLEPESICIDKFLHYKGI